MKMTDPVMSMLAMVDPITLHSRHGNSYQYVSLAVCGRAGARCPADQWPSGPDRVDDRSRPRLIAVGRPSVRRLVRRSPVANGIHVRSGSSGSVTSEVDRKCRRGGVEVCADAWRISDVSVCTTAKQSIPW